MKFEDRLAVLEHVAIPVWVFDILNLEMLWANARALAFLKAPDLAELRARDFKQVTAQMRTRQLVQQEAIAAGQSIEQQLTFYPHGEAVTARCHVSGIPLDDGRIVSLLQVLDAPGGVDPELVRGMEAIRHIWAIVSLLDESGAVLMQNPAGVRAFGPAGSYDTWFVDRAVAQAIDAEVRAGRIFRAEAAVQTLSGQRWHAVEAHRTVDPVSSAPAILVLQMDVTALMESRQTIARQREQIRALSTPILDVGPGALAVPLVGSLDGERSEEISTRLLPRIVAQQARSVILDLTGVDALDAKGIDALDRVVRAIQLLGARPIVTGIQPALAQALAGSSGDFSGVLTLRNLHQGLTVAMRGSRRHVNSTRPGA